MQIEWDIAERERHVVGEAPRIEPLAQSALSASDIVLIEDVRRGAGAPPLTGDAPEYMRTLIRHPDLFNVQMAMGTALYFGKLPPLERELAILRVGWLCGAPFEWGQHVSIAGRMGMQPEMIERARIGSSAEGWTEHEQAIVRGVEELLENKALSNETWDTLARTWDDQQMIEFPVMVGQYVATAYLQNTLRIRLEGCEAGLSAA